MIINTVVNSIRTCTEFVSKKCRADAFNFAFKMIDNTHEHKMINNTTKTNMYTTFLINNDI